MKCPKCDELIEEGVLISSRVSWMSKEYRKKHAFAPATKKGAQEAGMFSLKIGDMVTPTEGFFVCRKCGLMVAELPYIKEGAE